MCGSRYCPLEVGELTVNLNGFLCSDRRLAVRNDSNHWRLACGVRGSGRVVVIGDPASPLASSGILAGRRRLRTRPCRVMLL